MGQISYQRVTIFTVKKRIYYLGNLPRKEYTKNTNPSLSNNNEGFDKTSQHFIFMTWVLLLDQAIRRTDSILEVK